MTQLFEKIDERGGKGGVGWLYIWGYLGCGCFGCFFGHNLDLTLGTHIPRKRMEGRAVAVPNGVVTITH